MLVLAIDTATPAVTAGVVSVDRESGATRLLAERVTLDARAHGELLTPHVRDAVAEARHTLRDLDAIACGVGPGPYTGLRAGMVTAAALAHSLGIPAYPVCTLDAIAEDAERGEPFRVLTDARRKEVYWADYDAEGHRVDGPHVDKPADLHPAGRVLDHPRPTPLGLVGAAKAALLSGQTPGPLTPLYLRRPDAAEPGTRKRVTTS
ncbi:tRNA (adenosine(37)-N6)-threonylcarbamoyltransferase complex dimerization subunit type 1 TsaB [Prauserella sp. PE36]|uniref:tRNA (Adenosine(37)-N6)-threonylcarbamoyltransferase complex dimerization subunit type 1 TsaB n=1 Tax=Prauserella endophytica TaxID=1592324 RepID=A0ABY2S0X0_9PSEU|nr:MULTISPECIES: tRNA (adenosine(37)-N6)-threonylcarbamoyltransferase complex dimerization subunit type 1 TsaB [Prauserella]RBM24209.1 tRNA (adenosine(37)-N6)-threonylcarbamoyltransferase complex dimerization subunit type 1 TsaB [Prauserella sp. PE36]TKG67657.1 tRNA (adenosine(37)-N6)-threonylcarbamoyltransferase complex dimerization subunit type 1 TsaB [Prauserella endophytica]